MKKIFLFFSLIIILFFSSCSNIQESFIGNNKDSSFGGGSKKPSPETGGINLKILGLETLFEGEEKNLNLQFENYQKHEIQNLKIKITGFDTGFTDNKQQNYNIDSINSNEGNIQGIANLKYTFSFNEILTDYEANFNVNYCYEAQSVFDYSLCIQDIEKSECQDSKNSQNIGPLLISLDKKTITKKKIILTIKVEDILIGRNVDTCFENTENKFSSSFKIIEKKLGVQDLNCKPSQSSKYEIYKDSNSGFITCEVERKKYSDGETNTNLRIGIKSLYEQKKAFPFTVKNIDDN